MAGGNGTIGGGVAVVLTAALLLLPGAAAQVVPPSGRGGVVPAQLGDPGRAALEARLGSMEEEVRRLTGRVEELEYENSQILDRLERLVGDVDARLSAVEQTPRAAAEAGPRAAEEPGPQARAEPPPRPAPPSTGPTRQPAPDVEPDAAAARGYVLGTLPRGAVPPPGATPAPPAGATPAARGPAGDVGYEGALGLLQAGRWDEAEQAFRSFAEKNPDDPRTPSAAYWQAETYFFRKDFPNAAATFARNYRTYGPEAAKAPDNLLKLGMSLAAMGDRDKACQTFGELAKRHANASAPIRQTLTRERASANCA